MNVKNRSSHFQNKGRSASNRASVVGALEYGADKMFKHSQT